MTSKLAMKRIMKRIHRVKGQMILELQETLFIYFALFILPL